MLDREHGARREEHRLTVLRLLETAGIRLSLEEGAAHEVSASVAILTAYLGEPARGNVLIGRRPVHGETDYWHANMGDRDCLDLAELVEMTLRGLGFTAQRERAVPNMVRFICAPTMTEPEHVALTE